jgi:hypothetical protein
LKSTQMRMLRVNDLTHAVVPRRRVAPSALLELAAASRDGPPRAVPRRFTAAA